MDQGQLQRLADELEAIYPRLIEEGFLLAMPGGGLATLTPLATAGKMIAEAIDAGGLQGPEFAAFRAGIRIVADSPRPDWAEVLRTGEVALPLPEIVEGRGKHWVSVTLYVAEQLRREAEGSEITLVPLTAEDVLILTVLAENRPRLLTQEAIAGATRLSDRTVRDRLKYLEDNGLTDRPLGLKKGSRITDSGCRNLGPR